MAANLASWLIRFYPSKALFNGVKHKEPKKQLYIFYAPLQQEKECTCPAEHSEGASAYPFKSLHNTVTLLFSSTRMYFADW